MTNIGDNWGTHAKKKKSIQPRITKDLNKDFQKKIILVEINDSKEAEEKKRIERGGEQMDLKTAGTKKLLKLTNVGNQLLYLV